MLQRDAVFVDIETTGGNALRDRITEVAVIRIHDGELVSEWSTLVNPLASIPEHIQRLTGIDNDMVMDLPPFEEIYKDILEQISDCVFIAHNARFDYGFLKNEFKRCDITFRAPVLCTVKLSRKLFPEYKRHNLDSLMQRHALNCSARHRAMGDAKVLFDFMQVLYKSFSSYEVDDVITELLKRPSLPPDLTEDDIDPLPESPGVYIFYDKQGVPIYVGKSVNIRDRVLSHFSGDHRSAKEMKISQNIHSIEFIPTSGELGALLTESRLIKKLFPTYNYRLRKYKALYTIFLDSDIGQAIPKIISVDQINPNEIDNHFGLFKSKKAATDTLRRLAKEHNLCLKQLNIESGKGVCFAYQLKQCKGVCVEQESVIHHNLRLMQAISPLKNKTWPYQNRIGIKETSRNQKYTDIHIFENWCYLGTAKDEEQLKQLSLFQKDELMFDLDTYKILVKYLKDHPNLDIVAI